MRRPKKITQEKRQRLHQMLDAVLDEACTEVSGTIEFLIGKGFGLVKKKRRREASKIRRKRTAKK